MVFELNVQSFSIYTFLPHAKYLLEKYPLRADNIKPKPGIALDLVNCLTFL